MIQVASYGAGSNSKGMICEMVRRGELLDAIVFCDTKGERPEIYADIPIFSAWLVDHGYPEITILNKTTNVFGEIVDSLERECILRKQLPSVAYGRKSCSDKWKQQPFRSWLSTKPWQVVTVCIGFDANEQGRADRGNACNNGYIKRYPLIEFGMGRKECIKAISDAGLSQPGKSACFFCPNNKKHEIKTLPDDLQDRAIFMEKNANLTTIKGLGRNFSWEDLIYAHRQQTTFEFTDITEEMPCGCYDG